MPHGLKYRVHTIGGLRFAKHKASVGENPNPQGVNGNSDRRSFVIGVDHREEPSLKYPLRAI